MAFAQLESAGNQSFNDFIVRVRDNLKSRNIITRVEFVGSRYKRTAIESSDYDNLFIKRDPSIRIRESKYPNFYYLTDQYGSEVNTADRLMMLKGEIEIALRAIGASSYARITAAYPPTVVVKYNKPGEIPFSVDMVYSLEVGNQIFVGKSPVQAAETNIWYKATALDEKDRMKTIDVNNGIGRMVVRRLKQLKEVEPGLKVVNSCAFEQALMYLKDQYPEALFWRENNMLKILEVILMFMEDAMRKGDLPSYFDQHNNTIMGLSEVQKDQLANRFRNLAANPRRVLELTN